jgi:hypothetical protein
MANFGKSFYETGDGRDEEGVFRWSVFRRVIILVYSYQLFFPFFPLLAIRLVGFISLY